MFRATATKQVWMLLAATLLVRALVPVGWMPDTGQTDVIVAKVCNANYVLRIPLKRDKSHKEGDAHKSGHCLFGGFANDAPLPEAEAFVMVRPPAEQLRVGVLATLLLRRTAYLTPPGRAPPVAA